MLDSILNNNHSLILDTTFHPSHLNEYFSKLCQHQSGGKFNAHPCERETTTDYEFIDVIRNSNYSIEHMMHETLSLITLDPKLRSYFYRPYITFSGPSLLFANHYSAGCEIAFQYMEEPELSYRDQNGLTVLHYIAENFLEIKQQKILTEKLVKYPHLLNICDNRGRVPTDIFMPPFATNFLRNYIEENEITIERRYIPFNPFELPSKKQKRIDSYFKKKQ
ncbi:predicted protein [Naegleria gruberi]|uniref:Predicted protein n=1 Tax=Naegleria gruberi TaxID=5762 RepID=D2W215_NAEGR|nr:uncharacterized protein NAEGRDRAFT_75424 [Naegleria gruberi]EFC36861.1 predicted protein [Naegleria gruberi]|eukprot:XP_002669605.1 predicted protein [Naegleria gruberi strain NEG-M]